MIAEEKDEFSMENTTTENFLIMSTYKFFKVSSKLVQKVHHCHGASLVFRYQSASKSVRDSLPVIKNAVLIDIGDKSTDAVTNEKAFSFVLILGQPV